MRSSLKVALALTAALGLGVAQNASATLIGGFMGAYDPANWSLNLSNSDGGVDASGAPAQIIVCGPNNGSGNPGFTDYEIVIAGNGLLSFDWLYNTPDTFGPGFDPAGYVLNSTFVNILDGSTDLMQMGHEDIAVIVGDIFAFRVESTDNTSSGLAGFLTGPDGQTKLTITNFSAPDAGATTSGTTSGGTATAGTPTATAGNSTGGSTNNGGTTGAIPEPVTSTLGLMCLAALGTKLTRRPVRA